MMNRTGIGVIGLGLWGETIIETLLGIREARVTAVCSRSITRSKEISEKFSIDDYYDDYEKLVNDPYVQISCGSDRRTPPCRTQL